MTRRLLLVTNDFPPRPGGIQSFLHGIVSRLPADEIVVLTSRWRGWQEWDATQPYPIARHDTSVLLPTPAVRRHALALMAEHGCSDVWFGAAAPLGLLAPALRAAGARRIVATTHGHEVGWAALPGTSAALRRVAAAVDIVTYLGDYTRGRLAGAIAPYDDRLRRLAPAVDSTVFTPAAREPRRRQELGLANSPVVVAVSLMPRKGQDMLIRALPEIRRRVSGTTLLLVGGGPSRARLERLAADNGVGPHVLFTGSVSHADLPAWYAVGDVFAMPVRERLGGLDVEGLGIVFLEAAACGLPLVAGRSGGSVETVVDGETGLLVDGESVAQVAGAVASLLADPETAAQLGRRAREWVSEKWSWEVTLRDFHAAFAEPREKWL